MSTLDEVKRMQDEGKSEQEIMSSLRARGLSNREISNTFSQLKIKGAVSGEPHMAELPPLPTPYQERTGPVSAGQTAVAQHKAPATQEQGIQEGQMSMMTPEAPEEGDIFSDSTESPQIQAPQRGYPQAPQAEAPEEEAFYQTQPQSYAPIPAQTSFSPDTISEISEQVVAEKLSPLRKQLERTLDLKTTIDSKLSYMEERLKRIESIIDKLQLSILQKVGEYVTDVSDIKKEMVETQKSFKALSEKHHKK